MNSMLRSRQARSTIASAFALALAGAGIACVWFILRAGRADTGILTDALLAVVVAGVIGLAAGGAIAHTQETRVAGITRSARKLADGDLSETRLATPSDPDDPFAALSESLNALRERLRVLGSSAAGDRDVLASVLTHMDDGILILRTDESVEFANPAAERILDLSDGLPHQRSLVMALRDHQLVRSVRASLTSATRPAAVDQIARPYDVGSGRRHLRVQATPLESGRGLVVLQDLTEIRRAETIRRDFVANVSHDLRTPLASLKALVDTLRDGALEDPPAAQDFLARMEVELDDLTQLVLELLELSKIESGRVALASDAIDVADLLEQAVERLRAQADRAGLEVRVSSAPAIPTFMGDQGRIRQALINLIHNAVKFTLPGGRIEVLGDLGRHSPGCPTVELLPRDALAPRATHVVFSVVDTGVGIALEDQPRIFERFYRADKARSGGGTGLGLAIVKHVAEAHGGKVWVESRPGVGSTFRLALPLRGPSTLDMMDS
jgi:two-component system, OmpR family, phosphate regulon sensor histidine kinase PhoR